MVSFVAPLAIAFGVTFVAELGDKTHLLAMNFGARHPMRTVVAGLAIGYAAAGAVAAGVGRLLGATLPDRLIRLVDLTVGRRADTLPERSFRRVGGGAV